MSKVLRLFISSTFEDFRLERAVLQKFVFPEVREVAHKKGLSFLPIDLRWGVSDESQIDQRTMDICLDEVARASIDPHPDFLILSGDKYGWIPLPRVIEKNEFEKILNKLKELNQDISILEKWYILDKNQLPASYILKAKDAENDKDYTIWENWEQVENEIRKLLQLGVNNLDFDTQTKAKYFTSATHEEFKTLLKHKEDKELKEHIFTFIRKFKTINNKKLFDENSDKIETFRKELKNNTLEDNLKEVEVSSKFYEEEFNKQKKDKNYFIENIFEDINSLEELKEIPEFGEYLVEFANFIKNKLINSIESINIENLSEKDYQKEYKNYILSKPLIARDNEIQEIKEAIEKNNKVLIYGESGVGKSAIMAKVIDDFETENIIYRFCKATPTSSSLISMLNSILKELGFEIEEKEKNLNDLANSQEDIKKELQEIGYKLNQIDKKTIIILDAIDQLGSAKIDELEWLPYNDNVKLVISTLNDKNYQDDTEYYQKLKSMISSQIEIKRLENPQEILKDLLKKENRTLTDEQYKYVLNKPDSNKPLYLTIAKEEVKFWQSTDTLTDDKTKETKIIRYLSDTQQEIIKEFISNLSTIHYNSKELVDRVFGYISASKQHLSEEILLKVLSKDNDLLKNIENKYHKNLTNDLPPAVWARFRWMIKDYITEDIDGYIKFYHREFESIIDEFYSNELAKKLNLILEDIFFDKNENINFLIAHAYTLANRENHNDKIDYERIVEIFLKNLEEDNIEWYLELLFNKANKISKQINPLEAIGYYKVTLNISTLLYEINPERWVEDYTINLNNLALLLKDIGELQEAIELEKEALQIRKELYEKAPEKWVEKYASSLNNLSISFYHIGELQEAIELEKESLEIRKELYDKNPERWVEDYTKSLNNLAGFLKNIGELQEAIELEKESLEIRKELYDKNPERWAEDYITILNNLAISLKDIGELNKAIELFKESVKITKELYERNPERWVELYTKSLNNLATSLKNIGELQEAIELFKESLEITKELYERSPERWVELYTTILNNLATSLKSIGELQEAIELEKEALQIRKELYEKAPEKWVEKYASSLNNLSISFYHIGELQEAIELVKEALKITKELYVKSPERWAEGYTESLNNLATSLKSIGEVQEAIELQQEALKIIKELYEKSPERWAEDYITILNNLAISLKDIGELNKAIELFKESVKITKELYERNPERWIENYTRTLNSLSILFYYIGEVQEAIELQQEALKIIKELYEKSPERWVELYTIHLNNLAAFLKDIGEIKETIELLKESLEIRRDLYKKSPERWVELYTQSLNSLVISLKDIGEVQEAIELEKESFYVIKKLYEKNSEKWIESYRRVLNSLRITYEEKGDIKAIKLLNLDELELEKNDTDEWEEKYIKALNEVGDIYYKENNFEKSEEYYIKALEILNKDKNKWPQLLRITQTNLRLLNNLRQNQNIDNNKEIENIEQKKDIQISKNIKKETFWNKIKKIFS